MKILKKIKESIGEEYVPIVRPKTKKLFIKTLKKNRPSKVLEIGTGVGYSGCIILKTLPKATLTTLDIDQLRITRAQYNFDRFGFGNRVTTILGDAALVLPTLEEKFDFIFLDGPKGQYIKYLPDLMRLLNDGGTIFADNVLFMGLVALDDDEVVPHKHRTATVNLRKYLEAVNQPPFKTKVFEIEDGIAISKKVL